MVYETGDNTTVAEGEAVPLDLFYSRATVWGDDYELVGVLRPRLVRSIEALDWLENDLMISPAKRAYSANPGGTFYLRGLEPVEGEILTDGHELIYESDIWFRRLMYLPDDHRQ